MTSRPPCSFQSIARMWDEWYKAISGCLRDDFFLAVHTSLEVEDGGRKEIAICRAGQNADRSSAGRCGGYYRVQDG